MFHLSVKVVSRVKGRSVTAAAAYRAGALVKDDRTGLEHNYTRQRDVLASQIILPVGAPEWARDRSKLWSAAETAERRRDATVGREWEIAFPIALMADTRQALAVEYATWLSRRYSIPIDLALHAPSRKGDRRNFHAHLLGSTRTLGRDGFGPKTRQLDDGRGYAEVVRCREEWARLCNRELAKIGAPLISAKSLAAQREDALATAEHHEKAAARLDSWRHHDIQNARSAANQARREAEELDREPTIHVGPAGTEMKRSGRQSRRAAENEAILAGNETRRRARLSAKPAPPAIAPATPVRPAARTVPSAPSTPVVARPAVPVKPAPPATPAALAPPAAPIPPATPAKPVVPPAPARPATKTPPPVGREPPPKPQATPAAPVRPAIAAKPAAPTAPARPAATTPPPTARQPAPPPVQAPPIKPKKPVDTQHELENALITALESQTPRIQGICANAFQRQREIPTNRGIIKDYAGKDAPSFLVKLLEATWEKASKTLIDVMMRYWRERNQRLWAASRDKPKPGRGIGD